jgi:hypothetical protein
MRAFVHCMIGACFACTSFAFDPGADDITTVSGRTSKDYVRTRLASGSFAPETYAFGKGGNWAGAKVDASIDKLNFLNVARMIALPLANQNYLPSKDPKTMKLLIMVYWGTTHSPENSGLGGSQLVEWWQLGGDLEKDVAVAGAKMAKQIDRSNAAMLGYDSWWAETQGDNKGTALGNERQDLLTEIEEDRYFVVLMAYDFQLIWKEKKHKLLWETRFSIRQRHHDFDKDLPAMAQFASQYFGQDSDGLVHKAIPLGHVEIGEVKSLGEVTEKPSTDTAQLPPKP